MASEENTSVSDVKSQTGIPQAEFIEDVDSFMKRMEEPAEAVLKKIDEQHSKYKFMEYNLNTKKARLKAQIPDIKTSLDIVKHLQSRKESLDAMETRFLLSDQVHAKAKIPPTDKVCLWLGNIDSQHRAIQFELQKANVMLEYNLNDADILLSKNLDAANKSLQQVDDDLSYIRDQTTTCEVNMARVYNWDVKRRQALQGKS